MGKTSQERMNEIVDQGGLVFISLSDAHAIAKEYGCEVDQLPHPIRVDRSGVIPPGEAMAARVPQNIDFGIGAIRAPDIGPWDLGLSRPTHNGGESDDG